ncbi:MAG: redox-regulated ATPase YchF [Candidatus Thermoplasmatota archaeon]|jgi:ribosome-binding ATPase YchF (GTP1/OBG family)|nr:redox-regulated ATPase YchF [Candidatus Thermoplasmatota archaeon]MCL5789335.1 redox-regulated ATPase YchF [Candidatus Thermoplasmatota archaeon]
MSVLIGIIGKPNVGKSTFFSALTENAVEIGDYPFTTIESNRGVAYVRTKCPETDLGKKCNPNFGKCFNGTRFIPVELIDVAGLVPGAHEGKGLGNKFLDDLRRADGFIQVIDSTGSLDQNGNSVGRGRFDPLEDAEFVHREIILWLANIISDGLIRKLRKLESEGGKLEDIIYEKLSGLGIDPKDVSQALKNAAVPSNLKNWDDQVSMRIAEEIIRLSKPGIIVATKADKIDHDESTKLKEKGVQVVSGDYELVLRRASKAGLISYLPGDVSFTLADPGKLTPAQLDALKRVEDFMRVNGGTRTQEALEYIVYQVLKMIVVYPVEDENHWTDKNGNVLPDAVLLKQGSTAIDLAYKVHSDLGDRFIRAINGRTKRVLGRDHVLEDGDVIKIVAAR